MKRCKKATASLLTALMVLSFLPLAALSTARAVECSHIHDEECGYVEGMPCKHEHDAGCGYVAGMPCGHVHDEECGYNEDTGICEHVHDGECGYAESAPCTHIHDEECGYVEGAPCSHICDETCFGTPPHEVFITIADDDENSAILYLPVGEPVTDEILLAGVSAEDENGSIVPVTVKDAGGLNMDDPEPCYDTDETPLPYIITYEAAHPEDDSITTTAEREAYVIMAFVMLSGIGALDADSPIINLEWTTMASPPTYVSYEWDDSATGGLELTPNTNANTTVRLQMDFSLPPNQSAAAGEIEIRIPMYIFQNRAGANLTASGYAGKLDLSKDVPTGPTGFYYTIDTATNEYVIKNFQDFGASEKFVCQIPYTFLPTDVPDGFEKEITAKATFTPSAGTPEVSASNALQVKLNTSVEPYGSLQGTLAKKTIDRYETWLDAWGTKPTGLADGGDDTDYCYIIWEITYTHIRNRSTQPYSVKLLDNIGKLVDGVYEMDGAGELIGIGTSQTGTFIPPATEAVTTTIARTTFTPATFDTSSATQATVRYALVRYKKDTLENIVLEENDGASAFNTVSAELWGYDNTGYKVTAANLAILNGNYTDTTDHKSTATRTSLEAPDAVRTAIGPYIYSEAAFEFPGNPGGGPGWDGFSTTKALSESLRLSPYGAAQGAVNILNNGNSVNFFGSSTTANTAYTYSIYGNSQAFSQTFSPSAPPNLTPNTPGFEGYIQDRNYTTELIDDLVFLNDTKLNAGDYNFVNCYAAFIEYDYRINTTTQRYAKTTNTTYPSTNAVEVWYKSTANPGVWTKDGTLTKTGTQTYSYSYEDLTKSTYALNNTGITGIQYLTSGTPIILPAGTYEVKFVHSGARFAVEMKAYLSLELNSTDHVKSILATNPTPVLLNIHSLYVENLTNDVLNSFTATSTNFTATPNARETTLLHDRDEFKIPYGNIVFHGAASFTLRGFTSGTTINKTAAPTTAVDVYAEAIQTSVQTINAFEYVRYTAGSIANITEMFDKGIISEQLTGTFYDLLPKGTTYRGLTVTPYNEPAASGITLTPTTSTCDFTVETVANWQGSGRTMLIVHAEVRMDENTGTTSNRSGSYNTANMYYNLYSGFQLKYTLVNSYDNIVDNTAENATNYAVRNLVAYRAGVGKLLGGTTSPAGFNNGTYGNHQQHFYTLGSIVPAPSTAIRDDNNQNTVYNTADITFNKPAATVYGIFKRVKAEDDIAFTTSTKVIPGGIYTYQLRYTNGDDGKATNVVLYDVLETEGDWLGMPINVDVTYAESKGIAPVVYYSTVPRGSLKPFRGNESITEVDKWNDQLLYIEDHSTLVGNGTWQPMVQNGSIWTFPSGVDPEDVTAIAVDFSTKAGGGLFEFKEKLSVYCLINMRAPTDPAEVDRIMQGYLPGYSLTDILEARNWISYTSDYNLSGTHNFTNKQSEKTIVILRDVDVDIDKTSNPASGASMGTAHAVNTEDDIVYTVTVVNKDKVSLEDIVVVDTVPEKLLIDMSGIMFYTGSNKASAQPVGPAARVSVSRVGQKLTFTIKSMFVGETINLIIPVEVDADAAMGTTFENKAVITEINGAVYEIESDPTYHAVFPSITLTGRKVLTGRALMLGEFEFILVETDSAGTRILGSEQSVFNAAGGGTGTGAITFPTLEFRTADIGKTFYYDIYELKPSSPLYGVAYDTRVYKLTVRVELVAGVIELMTSLTVGGSPSIDLDNVVFENTYTPPTAPLTFTGYKTYDNVNNPMSEGQFSFTVRETVGAYNTIAHGTNDEDGNIFFDFDPPVVYTLADVGKTFTYLVSEDGAGLPSWIIGDSSIYTVTVSITQTGGQFGPITATPVITPGGSIGFYNEYAPPGYLTLYATKTAENGISLDGTEFIFTVVDEKGDPAMDRYGNPVIGKSLGNIVMFSPIKYMLPDVGKVFKYTIAEDTAKLPAGWEADPNACSYTIYVKITDDGLGLLKATPYEDEDCTIPIEDLEEFLVFNNILKKGDLIISKTFSVADDSMPVTFIVTGNSGDPVNLLRPGVDVTYYSIGGAIVATDLANGWFTIIDGTEVIISGLPINEIFTITEIVPFGFEPPAVSIDGTPAANGVSTEVYYGAPVHIGFTNTKTPTGSLMVSKTFTVPEDSVPVTFTVTYSSGIPVNLSIITGVTIEKTGGTGEFSAASLELESGQFTLTHDTEVTIRGLPLGETYTVTETVPSGFEAPDVAGGTPVKNGARTGLNSVTPASIAFNNSAIGAVTRYGTLIVSKTFAVPDDSVAVTFTVMDDAGTPVDLTLPGITVAKTGGTGAYNATNLAGGQFTLTHDTEVAISGLLLGETYIVTETVPGGFMPPEVANGPTLTKIANGASAELNDETPVTMAFTNNSIDSAVKTGSLIVSKTFAVPDDSIAVTFTVTDGSGVPVDLAIPGITVAKTGGTGTFSATNLTGGQFTLTHDTEVTISGLPLGMTFTVTETVPAGFNIPSVSGGVNVANGASAQTSESDPPIIAFTNSIFMGGYGGDIPDDPDPQPEPEPYTEFEPILEPLEEEPIEDEDLPEETEPQPGGRERSSMPVPTMPDNDLVADGDDWIEIDGETGIPLGTWKWDPVLNEWVFEPYVPLGGVLEIPQTGINEMWILPVVMLGLCLIALGILLTSKRRYRSKLILEQLTSDESSPEILRNGDNDSEIAELVLESEQNPTIHENTSKRRRRNRE